jgi:hypothetical protein
MVPTTLGPHSLTASTASRVVQCSKTILSYEDRSQKSFSQWAEVVLIRRVGTNLGKLGMQALERREKG